MPPEREDARVSQLEALRRYFAQLGQRDRPTVETAEAQPTSERQRRPSRPWLLLTGLLVMVALVGGLFVGAVAWSDDRPPGGTGSAAVPSATQRPTATAGPKASAACKTAVDRANAMLASAVKLRGVVAEQARVLRDPATRRLSGPEVLEKLAPALQAASGEAARFDRALADYRQVVDQCKLQAP